MAPASSYDSVAVRLAQPEDEEAICRVAVLDSGTAPTGRVLVGEADGEVIAGLSVDDGHSVADPFRRTSDVIALLEKRAEQLRDDGQPASARTLRSAYTFAWCAICWWNATRRRFVRRWQ